MSCVYANCPYVCAAMCVFSLCVACLFVVCVFFFFFCVIIRLHVRIGICVHVYMLCNDGIMGMLLVLFCCCYDAMCVYVCSFLFSFFFFYDVIFSA